MEGTPFEVRAPWDQRLLGTVREAPRAWAVRAVDLLERAFALTRALPSHRRRSILEDAAAVIARDRESLARIIVDEAGKPIRTARAEVDRAVLTFRTAAEEAVRLPGEVLPLDLLPGAEDRWGIVRRFPVGPVFAITPFNFPLNLVAHKLAPAIAAGCPILLKPSPQTPFTALALARILLEAGWPPEALAVLPLSNDDAGWLLEHDHRLKLVSFTGSARVGWEIKRLSAKKRVVLELGGNAAMILHGDWGDISGPAAKAVAGGFTYAGQSCISVQRIYVERPLFHRFWGEVVDRAGKLVVGDPADEATDVGPVVRPSDAERIVSWVQAAEKAGATVLAGGGRKSSLVEPTVLSGVRSPQPLRDEEVFGPVVIIEPYDDFGAALAEVNRSRYGLQAGLFTRDMRNVLRAYDRLEVGALVVGDTPTWRLDPMPYGGVKDSGMGREGLRYAIEEMTEPKMLVVAL